MFVEASEVPPSFLLLLNSFKETPPRLGLVSVHVVGGPAFRGLGSGWRWCRCGASGVFGVCCCGWRDRKNGADGDPK